MSGPPTTILETEAALLLGKLVQEAGYELEVTARKGGADLAASRRSTIWATFHVDVDRARPLFLRVGATVWGGARIATRFDVAWDGPPDPRLRTFAHDRLAMACKKGREESPDHCDACPQPGHASMRK